MRKTLLVMVLLAAVVGGCGAGTAYDLTERDAVIAAAIEAKKGVVAFNQAVVAGTTLRRDSMVKAVGEGVKNVAVKTTTPEEAGKIAEEVVVLLLTHIENYAEQDRRRSQLFSVTIDNLDYIIEISEQGKQLALYRSDVSAQWRAYIQSSARKNIGTVTSITETE